MANHDTKSITIYRKSYQLPVLEGKSFEQLQIQIKQRQEIIKYQKRTKNTLFGLVKTSETITFEQKLQELEILVKDYNNLIAFLTEHKAVYQQFFAQLTNDLREVVKQKLQEAALQEKERLNLMQGESDPELLSILQNQEQQILGNVWLFGKAFLLMLKKIELINEGIEKITSDQDTQRELLTQMMTRLGKYKKVYGLQRKINKSGEEAGEMAEAAVNLEQYLKPFIGYFQGLIEQVCQQDSTMDRTMGEIKNLVQDIMASKTGNLMYSAGDDLSKNMLDFLVVNEQKKHRLINAVDQAKMQGIEWGWQQIDLEDCADLTTTITALQSHIDGKLGFYQSSVTNNELFEVNLETEKNINNQVFEVNLETEKNINNQVFEVNLETEKNINNQVFEVNLKSEKNINYQKLQKLLAQGNWKEADEETSHLLLKAMGKKRWIDVESTDLLKFPKSDLRTIDKLWLNASDQKFGFSVQKQIWLDCGGTIGKYDYEVAKKFGDRVGWRKDGNWLNYSNPTFNTSALNGHLPVGGIGYFVGFGGLLGVKISFLASRL